MVVEIKLPQLADINLSMRLQKGNVFLYMSADYLIVGAGIAGSFLARALALRGRSVLMLDSPLAGGSSRVAAWMVNPITGIRFSASWRVDTFLPYARHFYQELSVESGLKLFYDHQILLFLQSAEELQRLNKKRADPLIQHYSSALPEDYLAPSSAKHPFFHAINTHGAINLSGGGRVDLGPWLIHFHQQPTTGVTFFLDHFEAKDLDIQTDHVRWKNQHFKKIIFCNGYSHLPWFDWLPWKAAKGEILTIHLLDYPLTDILKKGIFIIPLGQDLYRVGSTYDWDPLDSQPTPQGKEFLNQALKEIIRPPFLIVNHQAGVRPIIHGNKPVLGLHPRYPQLGILNGLASKGALAAPWLVDHLASHLEEQTMLEVEVDVARNL